MVHCSRGVAVLNILYHVTMVIAVKYTVHQVLMRYSAPSLWGFKPCPLTENCGPVFATSVSPENNTTACFIFLSQTFYYCFSCYPLTRQPCNRKWLGALWSSYFLFWGVVGIFSFSFRIAVWTLRCTALHCAWGLKWQLLGPVCVQTLSYCCSVLLYICSHRLSPIYCETTYYTVYPQCTAS